MKKILYLVEYKGATGAHKTLTDNHNIVYVIFKHSLCKVHLCAGYDVLPSLKELQTTILIT